MKDVKANADSKISLKSGWILVGLLVLFYINSWLDRSVISMVIDPIRADFGITDVEVSLLIGLAFGVAYAVGGLPMGWLVDRFSRRLVLYCGMTVWALAAVACGLSGNYTQLFMARMLVGLGESCFMPAAHSMISDTFPRRRLTLAISIFSMGSVIGSGVAWIVGGTAVEFLTRHQLAGGALLGDFQPWQLVFIATGAPGLLIAFLIFLVPEPIRKGRASDMGVSPVTWRAMGIFLRQNARLWISIFLIFGGMNIANAALIFWQPAYMIRFFDWNPLEAGTGLGLIIASAGISGLMFSGWMIDRMYSKGVKDATLRYYMWALIISLPFVFTALLTSNVWIYLGLIWTAKFGALNFLGIGSALVQMTTPNELRGRMSALVTTIVMSLIGSALGPTVPAFFADYVFHDNVRLGYSLAATLAVSASLAFIGIGLGLRPLRESIDREEARRAQEKSKRLQQA